MKPCEVEVRTLLQLSAEGNIYIDRFIIYPKNDVVYLKMELVDENMMWCKDEAIYLAVPMHIKLHFSYKIVSSTNSIFR